MEWQERFKIKPLQLHPLLRWAVLLCLVFENPVFAAGKICVIISDRNKIFTIIKDGIRENTKGEVQEVNLQDESISPMDAVRNFNPDVLITIGNAAALWAKKNAPETPCVASGVILQGNGDKLKDVSGISIDFPLAQYLKMIREALPAAKKIGVLYNPTRDSRMLSELKRSAEDFGLEIISEPVQKAQDISAALESIRAQQADVFLMTYDPLVMNSASFRYLIDFSIASRIPLAVPSKTLLTNGGLVSLEADYRKMGQDTAALANRLFADKSFVEPGKISMPAKKEVGVNLKMADVLKVQISQNFVNNADYIHR